MSTLTTGTDASPPLPSDAREARSAQILRAAAAVFAARGYEATRVHDIAAEAGVAYGLVYHYFGSKDRLLQTVFTRAWGAFADDLDGIARSGRAPPDQVRAVVDYLFGALDTFPDVVRVVVLEYGRAARAGGAGVAHPDVARALGSLAAIFRAGAEAGVLRPGLSPEALPVLVLGMLDAAFSVALSDPPAPGPSLDVSRSTLRALVRDGLFSTPHPAPHPAHPPEAPCTST
jgi:TetR/AcrR family fatty acid metabolism transcriptional regulator